MLVPTTSPTHPPYLIKRTLHLNENAPHTLMMHTAHFNENAPPPHAPPHQKNNARPNHLPQKKEGIV